MKSTRDKILTVLLKKPKSTVNELADSVSINAISVRHHLNSLQADGLINAEEERHGVGRPRLVYSLSEEGLEKFPTRYFRLANRILEQVRSSLSQEQMSDIFTEIAKDIAAEHQSTLKLMGIEEKMDFVQALLEEEGFFIEWEKKEDHYILHEVTCPYLHVVNQNPEVCKLDQALITELLHIPVNKINCMMDGDKRCSYQIPINVEATIE